MKNIVAIILIILCSCQKEKVESIHMEQSSNVIINYSAFPASTLVSTMQNDIIATTYAIQARRAFKMTYTAEQLAVVLAPYAKPFYEKYKSISTRSDYKSILQKVFAPPIPTPNPRTCLEALALDNKDCENTFLTEIAGCTIFAGWTGPTLLACYGATIFSGANCLNSAKRRYNACIINPYLIQFKPQPTTINPNSTLKPL